MKYIIAILFFLSGLYGKAQYNPTLFNNQNNAMGFAQATPSDARSMYYDQTATPKVFRDFQSKTEVVTYLSLTKNRFGGAPIFIHNGGTLSNGVWTGGTRDIYIFKDSTDINSLVYWNTIQSVNGRTGVVVVGNADSIRNKVVDFSTVYRNNYLLAIDTAANKIFLTPPTSGYTPGTGIDITGQVISALNTQALWNANAVRGRNYSTTPPNVGQSYVWNGIAWSPSSLNGLDTAYTNGDTLFLVNTFDTIPVLIKTLYNADDTISSDRVVELNGHNLTLGTTTGLGGNVNINGGNGTAVATGSFTTDGTSIGFDNGSALKAIQLYPSPATGIAVVDDANSFGMKYSNDYSTNGKTIPRWIPDIAAVRSTIHDSSGNYIKNDTTITQNGGFKLGIGSKGILDTSLTSNLFVGNLSTLNGRDLSTVSNIISARDTTNPIQAASYGIKSQTQVGFTSSPPSIFENVGGFFNAGILASNTQNWNAYPNSHPAIKGVTAQVYSIAGATGTIPKIASLYGTIAIANGMTITEANLLDLTFQHTGTLTNANGIRISDYDQGVNGCGIYSVLGDSKASPSGQYFLFDSTQYKSHFSGGVEVGGKTILGSYNSPNGILNIYQPQAGVGTISVSASGTSVTGTNTLFLYDFNIGDTITANSESHLITAISSNTSMTTTSWTNTFNGIYTLTGGTKFINAGKGVLLFNGTSPTSDDGFLNGSRTYNNATASNISNINNTAIFNQTVGGYSGSSRGAFIISQVGASNTQNWTGNGLYGIQTTANITNGASGTITNGNGIVLTVSNSSSSATLTNAIPVKSLYNFSNSGVITNGIGGLFLGLNQATNNTGLYLSTSTSNPTSPAGNYGIYDATGYNSYLGGTTGKVGIRLTSPHQALHVGGQVQIDTLTNGTAGTDSVVTVHNGVLGKVLPPTFGVYYIVTHNENNTSSITADTMSYSKVGNVVTMSGTMTVTPTLSTVQSNFTIELPFASNFTTTAQAGGGGAASSSSLDVVPLIIDADTTNKRVFIGFKPTITSAYTLNFTFTYRIY